MSGQLNSALNASTSNMPDPTGRPFANAFSFQSSADPAFQHSGGNQGLHNIHGSFNDPNIPGLLASRNAVVRGAPLDGRFASNNLPDSISQLSHGISYGHSGITNRGGGISLVGTGYSSSMNGVGGSIPRTPSSYGTSGNNNVPGMGGSPIFGLVDPRIASSKGNIVGANYIGRSINSGGLSVPGLTSRANFAANNVSGNPNLQGYNRLMNGILQQAPQMIGMLGNPYSTPGGSLSHGQMQAVNNPLSSIESSPFDMNDFPQLTRRPSSAGGPQGQLDSSRKQGIGVSSTVQQSQEFSIQNEDFPALPGYKGGSTELSMDLHQKEQFHDNVSMQSQHFPMATRSVAFNLGGTYPSTRQQQEQRAISGNTQDSHLHGSDMFPSSYSTYHSQIQNSGAPGIGLRPMSSSNPVSGVDQQIQQYQQRQNQSQFKDLDPFRLKGFLSTMNEKGPNHAILNGGIDLTTLGLNLNLADNLYKVFASPWADESINLGPEYRIPSCYNTKRPPPLQLKDFTKFQTSTLFYIFYSMPKDEAQLYAAIELSSRGWFYHKENQMWFSRVANEEPLKTNTCEIGSFIFFDPRTWKIVRKEDFVLQYEAVEEIPTL